MIGWSDDDDYAMEVRGSVRAQKRSFPELITRQLFRICQPLSRPAHTCQPFRSGSTRSTQDQFVQVLGGEYDVVS